ncbi:uncharacterized protein LOC112270901 isoform X2 [Brachypodium distachyon]|uniref:uncharacterized protein LOC112270901 isoform X2 n=1 Tax=Brachypodium distachyon TaxID=15368 RepID=UPI000D0D7F73|nr:uncharacterized protein LOC112270901 isoform X2 [Brachypodium distachyon]|eukprot:XP_024315265.1 uncharacterized protein LOC112270901 isoform X2 [Brachypodium distachyon]
MPPSSWFLLVFVWWLLLALAASDQEQQEQGGEGCSAPKRCGKLNISRPFWLTDWRTGRSCDRPDFEVTCFNNTTPPVLRSSLPRFGFAIINISYEERSLRVVDGHKLEAFSPQKKEASGRCVPSWNTSVRLAPPFSIDPVANMELIFYSCTEAAAAAHRDDGSSTPVEMPWFGNESNVFVRAGGRYGATGDGNYTIQGCAATVMPVQSSGEVDASHYKELIRHGFVLTWPAV